MKGTIQFAGLAFIVIILSSCYPQATNTGLLTQIDSLTYHNPDSAIISLSKLSDSIEMAPLETQMYYQLLTVKAKDKAYIIHESDSLILQIISYFEGQKNTHLLPEAYYYGGRIYTDLYNAPKALEYYQKAAELLSESTNYKLLQVIYSQMGDLLLYQDVYNEAMDAYWKSFHYNTLMSNEKGIIVNLCSIGETFTGYGNADSALYYYQKAYREVLKTKDKKLTDWVLLYLADLYRQLGETDSIQMLFRSYDLPQKPDYYYIIGDMYLAYNQLDSASYYYSKMLEADNMYANQKAHFRLAEIAEKIGDTESVMEHIRKYKEWTTEITQATNSETVHKMHSYYNYQLREKENNRLRLENEKQEKWMIAGIFILLLFISFIAGYVQYSKRKRTLLNIRLEKLEQLKEEQHQKSALFIEENKQTIERLERLLLQSNQESDAMKALLRAQKEQIQRMNQKAEADKEELELAEVVFRQSVIYNKFHLAANDGEQRISSEDWEALRIAVDQCYNKFSVRIRSLYPISNMELKVCLLLKIGISITGIALLCGRTKSAIVSVRKRLYEKTYQQKGKPEQWDEFILSL